MATFPNPLTTMWLDAAIESRPTKQSLKQTYLGLKIFPMREVSDYELTWDVVMSGNRMAGLYAHDGTPIPGDDYDFKQMMADVINIMASRTLEPQTVMILREPGEPSVRNVLVRGLREKHMRQYMQKLANADDEVEAVIEYLCLQALQGTIVWPPTDNSGNPITARPASWGDVASLTLSMGFRSSFVQNASTLVGFNSRAGAQLVWSNVNANPIQDLEVIAELITETTGIQAHGSTVIMSRTLLSQLAFNTNILLWVRGTYGPASNLSFIDVETLKNFIQTKLGYNIILYDAIWTYPTNLGSAAGVTENQVRFLPIGKVIIIPPGAVDGGTAFFATAPDNGGDNSYRSGKYTWFYQMPTPPWTSEFGVGIHGFPILKTSQELFVLNALS